MKWVIPIAALIAIAAIAAFANGGHGGPGPGGDLLRFGAWEKLDRIADEIGLSEEQRAQIKKIRTSGQKQLIDMEADFEKAEVDLRELLEDLNAKSSEIERLATKVSDMRSAVALFKLRIFLQMRDVLTPEQRAKAKELFEERADEMREMHQMKRGQTAPDAPAAPHEGCPYHGKGMAPGR